MGFFLQLKLLLWKNFTLRKRHKVRFITEIMWPLALFLILMWVRTRGLKVQKHTCHYAERPLPSAGYLPFLHGFFCNSVNTCHEKEISWDYPDNVTAQKQTEFREAVRYYADVLFRESSKRGTTFKVASFASMLSDIAQNDTSDSDAPGDLSMRDILGPVRGAKFEEHQLDFRITPAQVETALTEEDPQGALCNSISNDTSDVCTLPNAAWEIFQTEGKIFRESGLPGQVRGWKWMQLTSLVSGVGQDLMQALESTDDPTNPGPEINLPEGFCDLWDYIKKGSNDSEESAYVRKLRGELQPKVSGYDYDPDEPEACRDLYNGTNSLHAALWTILKPFVTGYVLYTPETPVTRELMSHVTSTFNDWIFWKFLGDDKNSTTNSTVPPNPANGAASMQGFLRSKTGRALADATLKSSSDMLQSLAESSTRRLNIGEFQDISIASNTSILEILKLARAFVKCNNWDRVVGMANETAAVDRAMELVEVNNLWALVVFDNAGNDTLNPFIKYRIRMSADRTDGTNAIRDRRTNVRSRDDPFRDTKYMTYGFLYLQDVIDSGIISMHTGRKDAERPGRTLQQFPYPGYLLDQFILAISYPFPMFMVLSWVYTSAMLIKSIVYEKEQRIKETLAVMGLTNSVQWAGWFIDSLCSMVITLTILSLILVYGRVVENSALSVVWVFLFSYCCATISFSFLISSLFSRANLAAAAGGIIFFLSYMPYPLLVRFTDVLPYGGVVGACLVSNIAFGLGAAVFGSYEQIGTGVQWEYIDTPATPEDVYSLSTVITMLWVDALVYGIATWYIEAVFPGDSGIPKPFYFFLTMSYWFPVRQARSEEDREIPPPSANGNGVERRNGFTRRQSGGADESGNNEVEPKGIVGVAIQGLTKLYNGKAAVNNLFLNFFEDQITCFLGHNGAGKTTTISMLTGQFPPSRGTARIYGLDIRSKMDLIRRSMGYCPQHNVLYDRLTVEEHLWFFGRIKGQPEKALSAEIDRMLLDMGLGDKRTALTCTLSGGMKRKLSVAMAYVGGSRTVFLDEPTAGVDPFSRRAIWELLIKYRPGRTVILTTHFMDEADLLGDRIAIISEGQLRCSGSGLFLKSRFGSGYYLTIEWLQSKDEDSPAVRSDQLRRLYDLVKSMAPGAEVKRAVGTEVVLVLPDRHDVLGITNILGALDDRRVQLGINSYGITDTTLEEVFLRVADKAEAQDGEDSAVPMENGSSVPSRRQDSVQYTGCRLVWQQFKALCRKRFLYSYRDVVGMFTQLVLPAVFVAISLTITSFFNIVNNQNELLLEPQVFEPPNIIFQEVRDGVYQHQFGAGYLTDIVSGGLGSVLVPGRQNYPDPPLPPVVNLLRHGAQRETANCTLDQPLTSIASGELMYNVTGLNVPAWLLESTPICRKNRMGGLSFGTDFLWFYGINTPAVEWNARKDLTRVWFDNKGHPSSPSYLSAVDNLILRSSLPASKKEHAEDYGILTSNHPLPLTSKQRSYRAVQEGGVVLLHAIALIFGMSFVPASFVMYLIDDRESMSKHLQLVSGMRRAVYWIQAFIWDLMCFSVSGMLVVGIFYLLGDDMYTSELNIIALSILILSYGWASIPLQYLLSWFFRIASMALVVLSCGNLFVGLITTLSVLVLQLFDDDPELSAIREVLEQAFLFFPQYCLGQGLMNVAKDYGASQMLRRKGIRVSTDPLSWDVTGKAVACMVVFGAVSFVMVLLVEYNVFRCLPKMPGDSEPPSGEDDVEDERRRVAERKTKNDILVLDHLTKLYRANARPAVNQATFGVHTGECFGLLGLNGAGKTSIFKMLTGDTVVSAGDAQVRGLSVRTDMNVVRNMIGYCPQFDALIPFLTVREHLELYSLLRGTPPKDVPQKVKFAVSKLNLEPHENKRAKSLSGGNKRKLSTAIALVGDPALVYLDEPTTSMDPAARRFLWDRVLSVVADGRSVVLTSHSMEECQALCGRLTIMVNGLLTCIGSPQHLKAKYGAGYTVLTRCVLERVEEAKNVVLTSLRHSTVMEEHLHKVKFHLPQGTKLVDVFQTLHEARQAGVVQEYSITQTTLEDVFIRFAKDQQEQQPVAEDKKSCCSWLPRCVSREKTVTPLPGDP